MQDGTSFPVNAKITQIGDSNNAAITQNVVTYIDGSLHQEGSDNVATLEQLGVVDLTFQGKQNGSDNFMSVRQHEVQATPTRMSRKPARKTRPTSTRMAPSAASLSNRPAT